MLKNLMNFYFSKSLASSSEYMERIMVNIFKYHIFKLLLSQRYFANPGKFCLMQPNFISLASSVFGVRMNNTSFNVFGELPF